MNYPTVTFFRSYATEQGHVDGSIVDIVFEDINGIEKTVRMCVRVVDDPLPEEGGPG